MQLIKQNPHRICNCHVKFSIFKKIFLVYLAINYNHNENVIKYYLLRLIT